MINCIFDINTAAGMGSHGTLYLNPVNTPVTYSGALIEAIPLQFDICGTGITASLVPMVYSGLFQGRHTTTPFYFSLPVGIDGSTVNVDNYLVNQIPCNVNFTAANAIQALSSSYALTASCALNGSSNISSSYAGTASVLLGSIQSASYAITSGFANTASYALNIPPIYNADSGLYYSLGVAGTVGSEYITINQL